MLLLLKSILWLFKSVSGLLESSTGLAEGSLRLHNVSLGVRAGALRSSSADTLSSTNLLLTVAVRAGAGGESA